MKLDAVAVFKTGDIELQKAFAEGAAAGYHREKAAVGCPYAHD
ncbi:hypothetical protein [Aureimonas sp. Leaf454]|nr:hypothetical protein [Aureimonas sp. Leaf454]